MPHAINPLDGRYAEKTKALVPYFSEFALMKYRVLVECEYLIALSALGETALRKFTGAEIETLKAIYGNFGDTAYEKIKNFEATTNHDVKAVEYFIKDELKQTSLADVIEWTHFALTSEDTNNIAYALMIRDSLTQVMIPQIEKVVSELNKLAKEHSNLPMLARTHGQSASPTTFGKEIRVFTARIEKQILGLKNTKIEAKLNGATGNFNAHVAAYPKINWIEFSTNFLKSLNLEPNLFTTQIECHDSYIATFDTIRRINTILIDLNQDFWRYISDGWITQKPKAGETGSSTMPHKVNPIDFENSEGNLGLANALFEFFARKLPISRLQRDLSDSTVQRAFGTAFGHSYLAYIMLEKGLGKITVNENKIKQVLMAHPEVIAEAIQTILRREGVEMPYEALKELTRGKEVAMTDFTNFIDSLKVADNVKAELKLITPENYTGLAPKLASM